MQHNIDNITSVSQTGTQDGRWPVGDHDQPYVYGRPINSRTHEAFGLSTSALARLMILRSHVKNDVLHLDTAQSEIILAVL